MLCSLLNISPAPEYSFLAFLGLQIVTRSQKANPTEYVYSSHAAEATAEAVFKASDGRAIFASGSPFSDVVLGELFRVSIPQFDPGFASL